MHQFPDSRKQNRIVCSVIVDIAVVVVVVPAATTEERKLRVGDEPNLRRCLGLLVEEGEDDRGAAHGVVEGFGLGERLDECLDQRGVGLLLVHVGAAKKILGSLSALVVVAVVVDSAIRIGAASDEFELIGRKAQESTAKKRAVGVFL